MAMLNNEMVYLQENGWTWTKMDLMQTNFHWMVRFQECSNLFLAQVIGFPPIYTNKNTSFQKIGEFRVQLAKMDHGARWLAICPSYNPTSQSLGGMILSKYTQLFSG
jgi:hypothetical protein